MKIRRLNWTSLTVIFALTLIWAACSQEEPTAIPPTPAEPESFPVQVTSYNMGETTLLQDQFPEDSPFRNMPVRLEGVIGLPEGEGPHPVVLIMHGSHASCPGENQWPCSAEEEQPNYAGFTYLVEALAKAGYLTLSINVNAEHTFGFGEAQPAVRTNQLIELHMAELAAANAGQSDGFGLDLTGRVDLSRMAWLGHSRGGEFANVIIRDQNLAEANDVRPYGPVQGLVQVAPALIVADSLPVANLPLAVILPACDQDLVNLDGQGYYESARLDPQRRAFATSVYLEGANHNGFNAILDPERSETPANRPDCTSGLTLDAEEQQTFLAQYTVDFLRLLFEEPELAQSAKQRLGILPSEPAPDGLYDLPARINLLLPPNDRLLLVQPQSAAELTRNLLGGEVQLTGVTALFCPAGYYVPNAEPGTEPCKRVNFNQPGYPQQLVVEWDSPDAEWRTSLPETSADLTQFAAFQLRAALDPLSKLNLEGQPQSFTVELVDTANRRAQVILPDVEYPAGVRQPNDFFEGDLFTGQVYMSTLRVPLEEFEGLDLANIVDIALLFDQTESGTLFIADLEFVKDGT